MSQDQETMLAVIETKDVQTVFVTPNGRMGEEGKREYDEWLTRYKQRSVKGSAKPLKYLTLPFNHPESKALRERRAAEGLRDGEFKSGGIK